MHRLRELLIPQQTADGRIARLDVRVKLIAALAAILAVVLSSRVWLPLGALACCAGWWAAARTPLRTVALRLGGPTALAAMVCGLKTFMTGATPISAMTFGPVALTATREGLVDGLLTASRVVASVSIILVLCMVTPSHHIFSAMRWARLPRTVVEIAVLMYRHLVTFVEHATNIQSAQKLRLGYATFRRAMHSSASLAGMVILRSIDQADRSHEAMVARGYEDSLQVPSLPALGLRDILVACLLVAAIVGAYGLGERWPL